MAKSAMNVGQILDRLAEVSSRPRAAFMILTLLAEQASPSGKAGPFVEDEEERLPLREFIGKRLARISGRDTRRRALELRVRAELKDRLPDDLLEAQEIVDRHVTERVRASGADNFSRVASELEKAGILTRHYEGYRTNHANKGGQRHLACVIDPEISAALRRRDRLI
ncbi:hypothetical protein [Sphingosinicella sp. BN140058]|uniref:hypothetical protein n=1 Tax=Sphingosinicella sp. BN140058 TaxID=1892855 RepID=UPI0010117C40|nr:hypothetical protein [Sphingosinicella sp. BN140058]QAY80408.1 hypothetical protein ETR14_27600 [Sphingosinicella sp. BN140058]